MSQQIALNKVRSIANYQFGKGAGIALFPENVEIKRSKTTGKIRFVFLRKKLIATLRAGDGMVALTLTGAKRLLNAFSIPKFRVVVKNEVASFIADGRNVFAKHVVKADPEIRPYEEVVVTMGNDRVLAVGKALLTGEEMLLFRRGVAVKVRKGLTEEHTHDAKN